MNKSAVSSRSCHCRCSRMVAMPRLGLSSVRTVRLLARPLSCIAAQDLGDAPQGRPSHQQAASHIMDRRWLLAATSVAYMSAAAAGPIGSADALPLAPLGAVTRVGGEKLTGLSDEEVKAILERDLSENQYFVTGSLTREIFADDCR